MTVRGALFDAEAQALLFTLTVFFLMRTDWEF